MSLKFEWDDDKNTENQKKHKMSFEEAILIFNDETKFEYDDENSTESEHRFIAKSPKKTVI